MSKNLSLTIVAAVIILGSSMPAMACDEGLTPGFWKNHPVQICVAGYDPGCMIPILSLKGGGENALLRHAAAAVLNAAHPCIDYPKSVCWIVDHVCEELSRGDPCRIEALKDKLEGWNSLGACW